jgi:flagellar biosynthesis chaperone FliJ
MKRFQWPLQRLLDVRQRQEEAARTELSAVNGQIAAVQKAIALREEFLRSLLAQMGRQTPDSRLADQQLFLDCCGGLQAQRFAVEAAAGGDRRVRRLRQQLADLRLQREQKMADFRKRKQARQTLQRLREEAKAVHDKDIQRFEQKQLDESAATSHVRKSAGARRSA